MVVPKRYAWKGTKWLKAIEIHEHDRRGFGKYVATIMMPFHFEEQRFSEDDDI